MKKAASHQSMYPTLKAIFNNGCFAWGVATDYRADWALATNYEQLETNVKTIQRNPG
jgi:hypothetical protein